jgi:hypothetical protein
MNFFYFISFYFLFLFSIVGYGNLFKSIFRQKENNLGYLGIFGILTLIIFTYFINFFIPIYSTLSLFMLVFGVCLFINFLTNNFKILKKDFIILILVFTILTIFILNAKNHDDFPYYHFSYINIITQLENVFGLGNFNHGFRTPSSIFYLSSVFNLPGADYNLIHLSPVFFLGFANFIFLKKIDLNLKNKENFSIILLSLMSLALINIFFYRMAEHGTDRSAQIIILLIFVEIIEYINKKYLVEEQLNKLIILITLAVSLKAFYLIYIILFFPLFILQQNKIYFFIKLITSKIFFICSFFFFILITINFINTGCFVYPLAMTCNENLIWSISISEVNYMNEWYQLWSKAGASPNYAVENRADYISNFNWLSNWIDVYFFNKVTDFVLGLIFLTIIIFILFFTKNLNFESFANKKIIILYSILILLFVEWFYNHPALRYGGYHLIALLIFIPSALFLDSKVKFDKSLSLKINVILLIILLVFCARNLNRISKEIKLYNYDIFKNASYNKEFKNYEILNSILEVKKCNLTNSSCGEKIIKSKMFMGKDLFYKER